MRETLSAASGMGCWWNECQARVSSIKNIADSLMSNGSADAFERSGDMDVLESLQQATLSKAGWAGSYGYLMVATGRADLMINPKMKVWDCGPYPVIFQEAGGYFGDWKGNATHHCEKSLATNSALLAQALEVISRKHFHELSDSGSLQPVPVDWQSINMDV
jgi:fructose-1,6-bisphosphatase/inositol monophosphatase family enzyme